MTFTSVDATIRFMYADDIIGLIGLIIILWVYLPEVVHRIRHKQLTDLNRSDLVLKLIACIAGSIYAIGNSVPILVILCLVGIAINALLLIKKAS